MSDVPLSPSALDKLMDVSSEAPSTTASAAASQSRPGAAGSRRGQRVVDPLCLIPGCQELKKKNQKWCKHHSQHVDNMKYAAAKANDDGAQKEKIATALKDDQKAIQMVQTWAEKNIASGLFRGGTVNWGEWNERFGLETSVTEGSRTTPFEKIQYLLRQQKKFGRTEAEALSLWNQAVASDAKRDYKGFQGQIRLWLPKEDYVLKESKRYVDQAAVEGSNRKKNVREADRDAMRLHVGELSTNFGHEFFANQSSLSAPAAGAQEAEQDEEEAAEELVPSPQKGEQTLTDGPVQAGGFTGKRKTGPTKLSDSEHEEGFCKAIAKGQGQGSKKKKVDVEAAKASFFAKMMTDMTARCMDVDKTMEVAVSKTREHSECNNLHSFGDKLSRTMYLRRLIGISAAMAKWSDRQLDDIVVKAKPTVESDRAAEAPKEPPAEAQNPLVAVSEGMLVLRYPQFFRSAQYMKDFAQKDVMETVTTMDDLDKKRLMWNRMMHPVVEAAANFKSSAGDLAKHLVSVEKAIVKAAAKEKEAKDKQAAAEAKEQVEKKAKHIQEKREHPFFQAVGDKLTDVKRLVVQGGLLKDTDFDEPFLIDASNETISQWSKIPQMLQVLSAYGSRFLKQESIKTELKHTQPLQPNMGKEHTSSMFDTLLANIDQNRIADLTSVSETWNTTSWLWGYAEKYNDCSFAPNSSGMFQVVVRGSVQVYALETSSLLEFLKKQWCGCDNVGQVCNFMLNLKAAEIDQVCKVVPSVHAKVTNGEALWVPTGWLLLLLADGASGAYGVRKSIFFKSKEGAKQYRAAMDLIKKSGTDISKMEEIFTKFAPPAEPST